MVTEGWYSGLAVDAVITVVIFWTTFLLSTITTSVLPLVAWAYAAAVVVGPVHRLGHESDRSQRVRRLGAYLARWAILFPLVLVAANAVVARSFAALTRASWAVGLPVVGPLVDTWTVWDATGLTIQILALTGVCVLVGLASALWRGVAWTTAPESA